MSSISTLYGQRVDKRAPEEEESEISNRAEKEILTPNGDVQYEINHSTMASVKDKTLPGKIKDSTPTCGEKVTDTTHIGDTTA